jgi:hypothetical protein
LSEKKSKIQENIDRQAKEWKEAHKDKPISKGAQEFADWFEKWENHIKTGKFKKPEAKEE